jgi:triosephosphate isomerase
MTSRDRTPLVCGNWKLHPPTIAASETLAREVIATLRSAESASPLGVDVAIAPVFTALSAVARIVAGTNVALCAQDTYAQEQGAFTGEVAPSMLLDAGCELCIVGHSERRQYFGETDAGVSKKRQALLARGLRPIVCVGEVLADRDAGRAIEVVLRQIDGCFDGADAASLTRCVVAYEPMWAIGTGKVAQPEDAQEMHLAIRRRLAVKFGEKSAAAMRILYGGSVKPDNAPDLMAEPDIDGALVGGASLDAKGFAAIARAAVRP